MDFGVVGIARDRGSGDGLGVTAEDIEAASPFDAFLEFAKKLDEAERELLGSPDVAERQ